MNAKGPILLLLITFAFAFPMKVFCGEAQPAPRFASHLDAMKERAGRVGIDVVSLGTGNTVWEYRSRETLVPASLVKILTSYAALKHLGPYHKFRTEVLTRAPAQGDTIQGDIWVRSEGDPFLVGEKAWTLAHSLRALGIRRILGGVHVDNGYFDPPVEPICLDDQCRRSYNPVLSATALDFNTVTFRISPGSRAGGPAQVDWFPPGNYVQVKTPASTAAKSSRTHLRIESLGLGRDGQEIFQISGKVPLDSKREYEYRFNITDPSVFVAQSFKALLQETGIQVAGSTAGQGTTPPDVRAIAIHESPPLGDMLYGLNRYSNNFMAEMLLRSMGGIVSGPPGSKAKGLAAIRKSLDSLGIPQDEAILDSGAGLSRTCRVSPHTFCSILLSAYRDFAIAPEFLASLAVNSQDGTLRRRIDRPGITVRGKTGTLSDAVCFAGYITAAGRDTLAATVLLNDVRDIYEARESIDAFLIDLPNLVNIKQ